MIRGLIVFPLLLLAVIFQTAIVSQIRLLAGCADLILVMLAAWALQERVETAWHWAFLAILLMGFVSRLPWIVTALGYFFVVYLARALQRRVWRAPLLSMFGVTFIGTLVMHALSFFGLRLLGAPLPLTDTLSLITLPSLLLNMLIAIPLFAWMRDLARWTYPSENNE